MLDVKSIMKGKARTRKPFGRKFHKKLMETMLSRDGKRELPEKALAREYRDLEDDFKELLEALLIAGIRYYTRGDIKKALEAYDTAIDLVPHFSNAWFLKGIAHASLGEVRSSFNCIDNFLLYFDSIEKFERQVITPITSLLKIEHEAERMREFLKAGTILVLLGDYYPSLLVFDHMIRTNPTNANAWYLKAIAFYASGVPVVARHCIKGLIANREGIGGASEMFVNADLEPPVIREKKPPIPAKSYLDLGKYAECPKCGNIALSIDESCIMCGEKLKREDTPPPVSKKESKPPAKEESKPKGRYAQYADSFEDEEFDFEVIESPYRAVD